VTASGTLVQVDAPFVEIERVGTPTNPVVGLTLA
jgi:hypothetical protein